MWVTCGGCRRKFDWPHEPSMRPWADCPKCHSLTKVGERPSLSPADLHMQTFGDSDHWNPWVPGLSPLDPPRLKAWEKRGWVRRNPATGAREGYCPTQAEYNLRVKELGFTTDNLGQGNRANRREGRDEWLPTEASTKKFFT